MVTAKVVNEFKELGHDGHIYKPGDVYPADSFSAEEERVQFLAGIHPLYKKVYLADVQKGDNLSHFPKDTGGGWYELSNSEKIQGKQKAVEAEAALKSGE